MPTPCGSLHLSYDGGRPVTLACSINHGHDGQHQAYRRDRLHHWTER